jgi:hypothetical protein
VQLYFALTNNLSMPRSYQEKSAVLLVVCVFSHNQDNLVVYFCAYTDQGGIYMRQKDDCVFTDDPPVT